MNIRQSVFFVALAASPALAAAVTPPKVVSAVTSPLPLPYDEQADAGRGIADALARARAEHKRVLLDFGGNWCPDCRILAGTLALPEVKPAVDRAFETVMIDVGRFSKNLDIAQRYGVAVKAVPTIIVLDPDEHPVGSGNPAALSDARSMTPQAIVDTVFAWADHK